MPKEHKMYKTNVFRSASKWLRVESHQIFTPNVKRYIILLAVVVFIALVLVDFFEPLHFKNVMTGKLTSFCK